MDTLGGAEQGPSLSNKIPVDPCVSGLIDISVAVTLP